MVFDGSTSYIDIGNAGSGVKTISFWMKANTTASRKIIDIDGTRHIELNGSSNVAATSFPGATAIYLDGAAATAVDRSWHHVVITDTTGVNASAMRLATSTNSANTAYFDGLIDDVRIYDRALSSDEIKRLYKIGATAKIGTTLDGPQSGLVGHWTFDGAALALGRAPDSSGNGNEGKLTNGPVRAAGKIGQGLAFDGVNDYVNITDPANGSLDFDVNANFTISAWIYMTSAPATYKLDNQVFCS
jgi:hypothetical protein